VSGPETQPSHAQASSVNARFLISPFNEILVGAALFASACISFWMTRAPNGIALLWPAGALAAALLIRLPRVRWSVAVVMVLLAAFFANKLVGHRPWGIAALFAGINGMEIGLMVAAFRFIWVFPYPNISISHAAIMAAVFGIAIPGLTAVVAGLVLHSQFALSFAQSTLYWWSSHAIGACLVGPPIILFSLKELKRLTRGRFLAENILTLLAGLGACYLAIRYLRFPFVSIGLLLLTASFRLGGFGTSLMSLSFGLLITNLWLLGIRPLGLDPAASASASLAGLPVIALLATVLPPITVGLGSDARRVAVRALRASERRFRESMEHSPIGMLIADLNGVWVFTNIALQQMLGYTTAEFRALPPGGPSDADDRKESETGWRRRLLTGEIELYDLARRFQHKDGHWIWTHVAVSILRDEEGMPLHLIAQIESLEARQRAEEKLAEERERLKITLRSINDAVITADAQTRITYLNPAAESLLGLDLKSVENRRVDEVIHFVDPDSSKTAANLIGQSALHGKVFRREQPCLLHRSDGTVCYVTDTVSPVLDGTGLVSGMVIVLRDATLDIDRARDLQFRAMHDPLTGLCNRTAFEQQLSSVLKRAHHLNRPAAVMAIDLDRFKALNDAAGHAAGDAMLRKVAEVCRTTVRSSDTVARLGGDEFAIILDNCAEERAILIGNQLLRALNSLEIEWQGSNYSIGASIGLAVCTMHMGNGQAWLEAADTACYIAKRTGRGQLEARHARKTT
jgi:diguanylate cyclase (GGDEF)-like protein/PAS domain S-box-containing protein